MKGFGSEPTLQSKGPDWLDERYSLCSYEIAPRMVVGWETVDRWNKILLFIDRGVVDTQSAIRLSEYYVGSL